VKCCEVPDDELRKQGLHICSVADQRNMREATATLAARYVLQRLAPRTPLVNEDGALATTLKQAD
jgi:hypothetical protein